MTAPATELRPAGARGLARPFLRLRVAGYAFFLPFFVVFLITVVAPLLYAIYLSFFQDRLIGGTVFAGLANYTRAVGDALFGAGLLRVALFLVVQVPIMLLIALGCALAIDSGRLRWPSLFRITIFMPYAVPAVVAALMWGYMYGDEFGLVGQIGDVFGVTLPDLMSRSWMLGSIGNMVTWEYVGYNMIILYAALRAIPEELYEAAEMDGAGAIRIAWSIKLPALRPALLVATVFSIIGSFQLFNEPNILQKLAPSVITTSYTPNMYAYNLAFNGQQINYSAAVAVVLGLVTVVVAYVVQLITARREQTL
ncbi:carbohydrate ABC transporter membrane protein 1 (CUT1 family) [Nonomuraea polychroma]|uniref:Carbohydrate ABC transporter membrane protein 1 (CUT1 family) n=1 Tax=Nonomuraea polychroma TaxID=46176 RepID=A0A438MD58_9ACTN|nr:sugar ABC transporter permease [Nonomuraea polychroma]RVX43733.1 carbohydrate ABC transporter membrane protein 1 (CUT1 family) [Nonomuraea polychroma]